MHGVGEIEAELRAISEEVLEARSVLGSRDDEDVANAAEGYSPEIPAISSGASGRALVVARVLLVDMVADAVECCKPTVCPNSCTIVRKKASA